MGGETRKRFVPRTALGRLVLVVVAAVGCARSATAGDAFDATPSSLVALHGDWRQAFHTQAQSGQYMWCGDANALAEYTLGSTVLADSVAGGAAAAASAGVGGWFELSFWVFPSTLHAGVVPVRAFVVRDGTGGVGPATQATLARDVDTATTGVGWVSLGFAHVPAFHHVRVRVGPQQSTGNGLLVVFDAVRATFLPSMGAAALPTAVASLLPSAFNELARTGDALVVTSDSPRLARTGAWTSVPWPAASHGAYLTGSLTGGAVSVSFDVFVGSSGLSGLSAFELRLSLRTPQSLGLPTATTDALSPTILVTVDKGTERLLSNTVAAVGAEGGEGAETAWLELATVRTPVPCVLRCALWTVLEHPGLPVVVDSVRVEVVSDGLDPPPLPSPSPSSLVFDAQPTSPSTHVVGNWSTVAHASAVGGSFLRGWEGTGAHSVGIDVAVGERGWYDTFLRSAPPPPPPTAGDPATGASEEGEEGEEGDEVWVVVGSGFAPPQLYLLNVSHAALSQANNGNGNNDGSSDSGEQEEAADGWAYVGRQLFDPARALARVTVSAQHTARAVSVDAVKVVLVSLASASPSHSASFSASASSTSTPSPSRSPPLPGDGEPSQQQSNVLVVDSIQHPHLATVTGAWSARTSLSAHGGSYLLGTHSTGAVSVAFSLSGLAAMRGGGGGAPSSSLFDVRVWFPEFMQDMLVVPVLVVSRVSGSTVVFVDVTGAGSSWLRVGTFAFEGQGEGEEVVVSAVGLVGFVAADAVQVVPHDGSGGDDDDGQGPTVSPSPHPRVTDSSTFEGGVAVVLAEAESVVVDALDQRLATVDGAWSVIHTTSSRAVNGDFLLGGSLLYPSVPASSVSFALPLDAAGTYDVSCWHEASASFSREARVVVARGAEVVDVLALDLRLRGRQWSLLGTFQFDGQRVNYVVVDASSAAGGVVVVDAIKVARLQASRSPSVSASVPTVSRSPLPSPSPSAVVAVALAPAASLDIDATPTNPLVALSGDWQYVADPSALGGGHFLAFANTASTASNATAAPPTSLFATVRVPVAAGRYEVFVRYGNTSPLGAHDVGAFVLVGDASDTALPVHLDMAHASHEWVLLGECEVGDGQGLSVALSPLRTTGLVSLDAVRVVNLAAPLAVPSASVGPSYIHTLRSDDDKASLGAVEVAALATAAIVVLILGAALVKRRLAARSLPKQLEGPTAKAAPSHPRRTTPPPSRGGKGEASGPRDGKEGDVDGAEESAEEWEAHRGNQQQGGEAREAGGEGGENERGKGKEEGVRGAQSQTTVGTGLVGEEDVESGTRSVVTLRRDDGHDDDNNDGDDDQDDNQSSVFPRAVYGSHNARLGASLEV